MEMKDIVKDIIAISKFKPDNLEKVKAFTNTYIYNLINVLGLNLKDYIIYLSGPVTKINDYEKRFEDMEFDVYKAYSAYNIYVINPAKILKLIDKYNLSYIDKTIICYSLLSLCNVLVYDNRDDNYKSSIGTFSEISFAVGKGIETVDYNYIFNSIDYKEHIINDDALANIEYVSKSAREIIEIVREKENMNTVESDDDPIDMERNKYYETE